jgi:flagellin-like hook-associated protein FlgL
MLTAIQNQLNEIQQDVNELKRKVEKVEDATSQNTSKLFKVDSSLSMVSNKISSLDKSFAAFKSVDKSKTKVKSKPKDFPATIECDTFESLQNFDELLSDYESNHALYYVSNMSISCLQINLL